MSKAPRPREHRGDIMSAETRSSLMARIRGSNTAPERRMAELLTDHRLTFETHARDLPGRPDFVFRDEMLAVFVDGDFWHGWRFPAWRHKLSEHWESKIEANRRRDRRSQAKLRRRGWKVVRIWEHKMKEDAMACMQRVLVALEAHSSGGKRPGRVMSHRITPRKSKVG